MSAVGLPPPCCRLVNSRDGVLAEICVADGVVVIHELDTGESIIRNCTRMSVTRDRWFDLASLLVARGYFGAAVLDRLESDVLAAGSLAGLPSETRLLVSTIAAVFQALEAEKVEVGDA